MQDPWEELEAAEDRIYEYEKQMEGYEKQHDRAVEAERRLQVAEARIKELEDVLRLCASDRQRIYAPEDPAVLALCEHYGYGAVMDSAARQWRRRDPMGAFTCGPCIGTLLKVLGIMRRDKHANES